MKSDSRGFDFEPVTRPIGTRRKEVTGSSLEAGIPKVFFPAEPAPKEVLPSDKEWKPDSSTLQSSASVGEIKVTDKLWTSRRGHSLTFGFLFLYATLTYFHPYELSPALAWTAWLPYSLAIFMLAIFIPTGLGLEGRKSVKALDAWPPGCINNYCRRLLRQLRVFKGEGKHHAVQKLDEHLRIPKLGQQWPGSTFTLRLRVSYLNNEN